MIKKTIIILTIMTTMNGVMAQETTTNSTGKWFIGAGSAIHNDKYSIGYQTAPVWKSTNSNIDLNLEYELSQWKAGSRYNSSGFSDNIWQASVTPMLNWHLNEKFYLQGGIGLNYFSENNFADKEFGTRLNFGSHLGMGYNFTPNTSLTYRVSHYSNGGIEKPNPGINMQQVILSHRF